jgi:hypothetical protein
MIARNGSTGWLVMRFGVVKVEARRLSVDLAGETPQRPKTQPPTFLVRPTVLGLEEAELEELTERASLVAVVGVRMLERR